MVFPTYFSVIFNQLNIKKIKLTKIILEKIIKKTEKNHIEKHCNNPQYFVRKATMLFSHYLAI
jgi:hypothetical protein